MLQGQTSEIRPLCLLMLSLGCQLVAQLASGARLDTAPRRMPQQLHCWLLIAMLIPDMPSVLFSVRGLCVENVGAVQQRSTLAAIPCSVMVVCKIASEMTTVSVSMCVQKDV